MYELIQPLEDTLFDAAFQLSDAIIPNVMESVLTGTTFDHAPIVGAIKAGYNIVKSIRDRHLLIQTVNFIAAFICNLWSAL
jgi:hypothetical protein